MRTLLVDHAAALRAKSTPTTKKQGVPIGFILTSGESSDYTAAEPLIALPLPKPIALLADKGYDGDRFRKSLLIRGILRIIAPRSNRKVPRHPDYRRYRDRNRVEGIFGNLKQQRRIATRYEKTVLWFESFLKLAAARLWLKSFDNTARALVGWRFLAPLRALANFRLTGLSN